jgi:hypothetical protein
MKRSKNRTHSAGPHCGPRPWPVGPQHGDGARVLGALAARSPRAVRARWRACRRPSGAQQATRFCLWALGELQGSARQGEEIRGSPKAHVNGGAEENGGAAELGRWWGAAMDGDVREEVLQ